MAYQVTTVAFGSTGNQSIPTSFVPAGFKITLGKKIGTTQNFSHQSVGWCDGTNVWSESFFQSDTAGKCFQSTSKIISHWESTASEVVAATFVNITAGGTPSINLNFSAVNANYNLNVEYWS